MGGGGGVLYGTPLRGGSGRSVAAGGGGGGAAGLDRHRSLRRPGVDRGGGRRDRGATPGLSRDEIWSGKGGVMGRKERGQSMLELALILPVLLVLILAVVEVGFAMRNYLLVMAANREGIRFAARGRFTDETIAQRIISAGGTIETADGSVTFLRTTGNAPNTGIIITHIPIQDDGTIPSGIIQYVTGTVSFSDTRPIQVSDSRVNMQVVADRHSDATVLINDIREANEYERLDNEVIVLEVFYAHDTLWNYDFIPLGDIYVMYTQSAMRVVSDARQME
ncbi:MAG TPA: hypothetical protein EYH30_02230 [Anaerolineales bacterium]|nr:hypothetical protein [Anaerolineae bacterium]HIQ00940.1 hypothetical protein [Anaerolineales bacterium]